jgi:hypothetical protein
MSYSFNLDSLDGSPAAIALQRTEARLRLRPGKAERKLRRL